MMAVLTVDGVQIVAQEQQLTSPAIHIKNSDGQMYHVALVPVDGGIYDGSETLVYEESTFNTCQEITLSAGIYRAELRGGSGGKPYKCTSGIGMQKFKSDVVSSIFKINQETTAYVLRGGDGNNSAKVANQQVSGGGASGVDSLLVVGNRVIRATGGSGTRCISGTVTGLNSGGYALFNSCYGGAGGVYPDVSINAGSTVKYQARGYCAAGGGGSNANGGGAAGAANSAYGFLEAGVDGSSTGGGNGGNAINTAGDSLTKNVGYGGIGGANISFSCGGQVATSYGGGGGGAMCFFPVASTCNNSGMWCDTDCVDGGNGGSGSTGTSTSSFVKIYKIG